MSRTRAIQQTSSPTNLLNIPRELRDEIFTLVLTHRHPSPKTPAEVEAQTRTWGGGGWSSSDLVSYLQNPRAYDTNAAGLLSTSTQLRIETEDVLKRLDLTHELDIKFVNERYLAPTWILIHTKPLHFKRVHVVLQSIGAWQVPAQRMKHSARDPWFPGNGGPPGYVWLFYNTLMHFLRWGISGPQNTDHSIDVCVERLELDFVDPENTELLPPLDKFANLQMARCQRARSARFSNEAHGPELLQPELLARDLTSSMLYLFGMDYHAAEHAELLHERIGEMVFLVNGALMQQLDVGQILADLEFNNSFSNVRRDYRVDTWIDWKEKAQLGRKKRGLKTVGFKDGWQDQARTAAAQYYARR